MFFIQTSSSFMTVAFAERPDHYALEHHHVVRTTKISHDIQIGVVVWLSVKHIEHITENDHY